MNWKHYGLAIIAGLICLTLATIARTLQNSSLTNEEWFQHPDHF